MSGAPRHVGVIPDGSRRWSRLNGVPLTESYHLAMRNLAGITDLLLASQVRSVSLYMLSVRNLLRPAEELAAVFEAESRFCSTLLPEVLRRHGAQAEVVGRNEGLPTDFLGALDGLRGIRGEAGRKVHLLVGYDAWEEVFAAMHGASSIEEARAALAVPEDVDLVIRTGGGALLSGFLPMQSQYAHIATVDALFNDLSPADVTAVLDEFAERTRLQGL
ncbi:MULTISPECIES: undecaprenyl diphosphate synthase family protein [unclassified Streptomyces]|uniref:undecaprenyl diphosphate synthase family protein n=1 Tax=unclassified Streptomyces TaxID=2593676 RepID=UPI002E2A158E|nr:MULTISPECIES: undecaprenyl diphosphate synthase family protein [unclassified Streptomyces]WUB90172.1 undecaprenyl diphosphate synthase family protein [Streptomyces sp. NBC_00566]